MVIYIREWSGKKKGVGSQWNAWDNIVATLPDRDQHCVADHQQRCTALNECDPENDIEPEQASEEKAGPGFPGPAFFCLPDA